MKSRASIFFILVLTVSLFSGCSTPQFVLAPKESVPVRDRLPEDVFGGYITVTTVDSSLISGELIGLRNDSLIILSDTIEIIDRNFVSKARVVVHLPNNYKTGGYVLMGLSGLVMLQAGEFGGGPVALGISGILLNGIGLASAQGTENMKINYYDWSEGWEKVIAYSRFPYGIPPTIKLSELMARTK